MRNVLDKIFEKNQNTHFMLNNSPLPPQKKNLTVHEIMGKNFVQPDR
jgi:hypothetical protein